VTDTKPNDPWGEMKDGTLARDEMVLIRSALRRGFDIPEATMKRLAAHLGLATAMYDHGNDEDRSRLRNLVETACKMRASDLAVAEFVTKQDRLDDGLPTENNWHIVIQEVKRDSNTESTPEAG